MKPTDKRINFRKDGKVIGAALLRDYHDGDIFLADYSISKEYRGQGLGRQTMNMLLSKYHVNCLSVAIDNQVALHLYKSLGFEIVSDPYYDKNAGETLYYMRLPGHNY